MVPHRQGGRDEPSRARFVAFRRIAHAAQRSWRSWQRGEDYYQEGELTWLDADTLIRELSNGQKSLDDFARAFFGVDDGQWLTPKPYRFDEVVTALILAPRR